MYPAILTFAMSICQVLFLRNPVKPLIDRSVQAPRSGSWHIAHVVLQYTRLSRYELLLSSLPDKVITWARSLFLTLPCCIGGIERIAHK
jgi:hypothetical protein